MKRTTDEVNNIENNSILNKILEWSLCIIVAVFLALIIRYYLVAPTMVKQSSMYPTLKEGERIVLSRINRTSNKEYKRGEIITFEAPSQGSQNISLEKPIAIYSNYSNNLIKKITYNVLEINKTSYIKRIIGISGDKIEIKDGKVYLNGEELQETYLVEGTTTSQSNYNNIIVPDGCVFVMGDNRNESMDSRSFGCIPIEKIEGIVWFRYWPLKEFGKIN